MCQTQSVKNRTEKNKYYDFFIGGSSSVTQCWPCVRACQLKCRKQKSLVVKRLLNTGNNRPVIDPAIQTIPFYWTEHDLLQIACFFVLSLQIIHFTIRQQILTHSKTLAMMTLCQAMPRIIFGLVPLPHQVISVLFLSHPLRREK